MTEYLRDLLTTHTHHFVLVTGLYEVNVIPTEDSDRLELAGSYLMTVRKEYLCLHSAKTGERVFQWELDHPPRFRLQRLSHLQDLDKVLHDISSGKVRVNFPFRQLNKGFRIPVVHSV